MLQKRDDKKMYPLEKPVGKILKPETRKMYTLEKPVGKMAKRIDRKMYEMIRPLDTGPAKPAAKKAPKAAVKRRKKK